MRRNYRRELAAICLRIRRRRANLFQAHRQFSRQNRPIDILVWLLFAAPASHCRKTHRLARRDSASPRFNMPLGHVQMLVAIAPLVAHPPFIDERIFLRRKAINRILIFVDANRAACRAACTHSQMPAQIPHALLVEKILIASAPPPGTSRPRSPRVYWPVDSPGIRRFLHRIRG